MSLDVEQRLREFFASAPQLVYQVVVLEISHSAMSKTYYLWREARAGEVTTEDGVRTVLSTNFEAKLAGTDANLDQVYEIALDTTDPEDDFRKEMKAVPVDTTERVRIVIREYLSDDLTDMQSRGVLQLETVSYKVGAAMLTAVSPRFNVTRTGELYTPRDFPMLRGFL